MGEPLVTVVIRTTGRPELSEALCSVAAQTYSRIEVILVDVEGKGSIALDEGCGNFEVRLISSGTHLSRGAAANVGLDAARGDYMVFLDDDDWFLSDHVACLVSAVSESESARAAYVGIECRRRNNLGMWERVHVFNEPYNPTRLLLENFLPIHAVLFERALLGKQLRFEETFQVYEDWDFWIPLSQLTTLVQVDRVTAVYRISSTSGFGVREDDARIDSGYVALLEKWRSLWTAEQLLAISSIPRLAARDAAEARRVIAMQAETITALRAQLSRTATDLE